MTRQDLARNPGEVLSPSGRSRGALPKWLPDSAGSCSAIWNSASQLGSNAPALAFGFVVASSRDVRASRGAVPEPSGSALIVASAALLALHYCARRR